VEARVSVGERRKSDGDSSVVWFEYSTYSV
jgi:hypothetical protein